MRPSGRAVDELRPVTLEVGGARHAEGSCLVRYGDTQSSARPPSRRGPAFPAQYRQGLGHGRIWMLPRATTTRMPREAARGKQSGRTLEIQRLIGRSLRAVTDLAGLGERQVVIDCDVLQADGGTRTASITGAWVALHQALRTLVSKGALPRLPLREPVAAISCGLVGGNVLLDLDYAEDSTAEADANFVMAGGGGIVEIQVTAEQRPVSHDEFAALQALARVGIGRLIELQHAALGLE